MAEDMKVQLIEAINDIEKEKGISKEILYNAIAEALIKAYKNHYSPNGDIKVSLNPETGKITIYTVYRIVDEVEDYNKEISLEEARDIDPDYNIGDEISYEVDPAEDFGRIAAQAAKQVVIQQLREAERNIIYDRYKVKVGQVVRGRISRISHKTVFVEYNGTEGILTPKEQVPGETYKMGQLLSVYLMDVRKSTKGSQLFFSRSHPGFVKALFTKEIPEIEDGIVEIKSIAREAGMRTKMAVYSYDNNVDPVGACVGTRGSRVQNIVEELRTEKIDIIQWSDNPLELIANVLSPAVVEEIDVNETLKEAFVIVPDNQLSLAIGRAGQNVRLAARVAGYKIDIKSSSQARAMRGDIDLEEFDQKGEIESLDVEQESDNE